MRALVLVISLSCISALTVAAACLAGLMPMSCPCLIYIICFVPVVCRLHYYFPVDRLLLLLCSAV